MVTLLLMVIYLAFISLGLPDSLLGSAWPVSHVYFGVDASWAGFVSVITALGTVLSSLMSTRLIHRYGTGKVTLVSVALTATALIGISYSHHFVFLCLFSVPLGLGGGNVDAALNNFVALHFESKHMSWLHSFWGIGASTGPVIMSYFLAQGTFWQGAYLSVSVIQMVLVFVIFISLPLWKKFELKAHIQHTSSVPISNQEALNRPYVKFGMLAFFVYVALEGGTGLWASSYLVQIKQIPVEQAATGVALFFGGLTFGRILDGFMAMKFSNVQRMRVGQAITGLGIGAIALAWTPLLSVMSLMLIGYGCAPMYPAMIHETPRRFKTEFSQAVIGLQMAASYVGFATMPLLFGLISRRTSLVILPIYLMLMLAVLIYANEKMNAQRSK